MSNMLANIMSLLDKAPAMGNQAKAVVRGLPDRYADILKIAERLLLLLIEAEGEIERTRTALVQEEAKTTALTKTVTDLTNERDNLKDKLKFTEDALDHATHTAHSQHLKAANAGTVNG